MTLQSALGDLLAPPAATPGGPRHPEFEVAIRRSQIIRIRILLTIAPVLLFSIPLRFYFTREMAGFIEVITLTVLMTLYEACVLWAAQRADRQDRSLPMWFWQLNAAIESLIPTVGITLIAWSGLIPPYRAVAVPMILAYGVFIILSILSLRPSLSLISGAVSLLGYAALLAQSYFIFDPPPGDPFPFSVLVLAFPNLLSLTLAAAGVSLQIRRYALAEIRETAQRESAEHELFVAGRIQGGLLPVDQPPIGDFQLAGWSRPAIQAGGDFYDWQQLPDGRVALVLADVSGHGIGPAVLAVLCRSYLRAALLQHQSLPATVASVNRLVQDDLPDGWFITLAVAVLLPDERSVELFSAGQGPLLHFHAATGNVDSLTADVPPLGVSRVLQTPEARVLVLAPGDFLAFVSDGFHEWPNPEGGRFGLERLSQSLVAHAQFEPRELIANLLADVERFSESTAQPDDLTAVVLKRKAG